ncbi:MAG: DUF1273 family protein [Clostridia bacterium]|nr:DUF1273 family protein [Clostridia bacterium]
MEINKYCAIIGETPEELSFGYDEDYLTCVEMKRDLLMAMVKQIEQGVTGFLTAVEQGAEMWCAEACLAMKSKGGQIELICAPTCEEQANRWHPERRERYFTILEQADDVCEGGDEYILSNAAVLLVLGHPAGTRAARLIDAARKRGLTLCQVS